MNDIFAKCPLSDPQCLHSSPRLVVVAIGFSNWTKEMCGNQPITLQTQPPIVEISHQVPPVPFPTDLNCSLDDNGNSAAWSFINKAKTNPDVNPSLVFVDCAEIGAVAGDWLDDDHPSPQIPTGLYTNCKTILGNTGWPGGPIDPSEVQVVLLKDSDSGKPVPLIPFP